ncbi:hypothetical protein PsorP6_004064 [Peronosclerospora sorghi]|uniref:Uncharacterized protein n=1 Tax=Peronosclerospora sorghi TaxID=230839 RepID=A0ACC0VK86_9STRA|nr:hypothetical protein PsorP6_004064 [Peronosclerospora sorghi]
MKAWSDEWTNARLRLYLREDQLFQGETINVQVLADVMPSSYHTKINRLKDAAESLQLWKDHCKEARVQIQVVEILETDIHASNSTPAPSTLLRQETHIFHVSMDQVEDKNDRPVIRLKTQFDLKIRQDFWNRPVLLIVHITPKNKIFHAAVESNDFSDVFRFGSKEFGRDLILRDEWARSQLVSHTRDETQTMPLMTRRVEQRVVVTNPLQLDIESRGLPKQRIGILAQASNRHSALALSVRDLHLHLNQPYRTLTTGTSYYRIVSGDKGPFPVVLQPQEQYNFLFILERGEGMMPTESLGPVNNNQVTPTSAPKGTAESSQAHCSGLQRSLLTFSWQALGVSMDAITEIRTIMWSPKATSHSFASFSSGENEPPIAIERLTTYVLGRPLNRGDRPDVDFKCVRLLPDAVLQTTIAPLSSSISAGKAVTVRVTVVNRSVCTVFDLTLALPPLIKSVSGGKSDAPPAAVGFEASHRLGLLRPGMSASRSLHVAFLRPGMCKLSSLVLVDHLTRSCFIFDEWEVFVRN